MGWLAVQMIGSHIVVSEHKKVRYRICKQADTPNLLIDTTYSVAQY